MQRPKNIIHSIFKRSISVETRVVITDEFHFLKEFPVEHCRRKAMQELEGGADIDWAIARVEEQEKEALNDTRVYERGFTSPFHAEQFHALANRLHSTQAKDEMLALFEEMIAFQFVQNETKENCYYRMFVLSRRRDSQSFLVRLAEQGRQSICDYIYQKMILPLTSDRGSHCQWAIHCHQSVEMICEMLNAPNLNIYHLGYFELYRGAAQTLKKHDGIKLIECIRALQLKAYPFSNLPVCSTLSAASAAGQVTNVEYLLKLCVDTPAQVIHDESIIASLKSACEKSQFEVVKQLVPELKKLAIDKYKSLELLGKILFMREINFAEYLLDQDALPGALTLILDERFPVLDHVKRFASRYKLKREVPVDISSLKLA